MAALASLLIQSHYNVLSFPFSLSSPFTELTPSSYIKDCKSQTEELIIMLVFEGPDNSGKSTIASYVSHELGIPLYHFGKPPKNVMDLRNRLKFMLENHDRYIFDRIPLISEQVYSILRTQNLLSVLNNAECFYTRFRDLNPLVVYCRPSTSIMLEGHKGKKHDSPEHLAAVEEKALQLIERYDQVMNSEYLPPCWYFDYTKQEHDVFLQEVEEELQQRKQYQEFYNQPRSN